MTILLSQLNDRTLEFLHAIADLCGMRQTAIALRVEMHNRAMEREYGAVELTGWDEGEA